MTCIANATTEPEVHEEIEITQEMIDAGGDVILRDREDVWAWALAESVYRAMELAKKDRRS
jgi:hypothetical protein